jgi:hypothetical protein
MELKWRRLAIGGDNESARVIERLETVRSLQPVALDIGNSSEGVLSINRRLRGWLSNGVRS